jgi:hypothetical protein
MDLLFLTFGPNIKNHYQANFCILSFLSQQEEVNSINVYTDQPDFYKHLHGYINVVFVTEQMLNDWKGTHDFFWRVKIKALEHFITANESSALVYLDSDTFLFKDVKEFKSLLKAKALMHEEEGKLSRLTSKTEKLMWQQVSNKSFGGITVHANHAMWNAGVVAIPANKNLQAVQLALAICDDMCAANVTRRLIEQFALSLALQETYGLAPAAKWIGHYWSNKEEWNGYISHFFLDSYLKGYTSKQDIDRMSNENYSQLPVRKIEKNTKIRLIRFLNKVFPPKEVSYIE